MASTKLLGKNNDEIKKGKISAIANDIINSINYFEGIIIMGLMIH